MASLLLRPFVQSCKQITVYSSLSKFSSTSKATYCVNSRKNYGSCISKTCFRFLSYSHIRFQSENYFDRGGSPKSEDLGSKRENIYTIPNALSLMRIGMAPCIGYYVVDQQYTLALSLFIIASFSDLIDGMIARRWPSQQSAIGSALDPLGDKILVASVCVAMTYANVLPFFITALFVGRDAVLSAAAFYLRYKTCPPPVTWKRYWDPTLVNVKLAPTYISKVNTAVQMLLIWASMAAPVFGYVDHAALKVLWAAASVTTVSSAFSYATRKDTVQVLDKLEKDDKK